MAALQTAGLVKNEFTYLLTHSLTYLPTYLLTAGLVKNSWSMNRLDAIGLTIHKSGKLTNPKHSSLVQQMNAHDEVSPPLFTS